MELDKILPQVEKPARYTGGEMNMVRKDGAEVSFVFAFPDLYEIGMSHLGGKIIYHMLNEREDTYCQRVYAPWVDMERKMRENQIPLFTLETHMPVKDTNLLGFTLQYEMSYTNILNMLDLSGIELYSNKRGEDTPFIFAGGPCSYHAEPLAPFVDFFALGDGEDELNDLIDLYKDWKKSGQPKLEFLRTLAKTQGFYVPSFYEPEYEESGIIKNIKIVDENAPPHAIRRVVQDFENAIFPTKIIVPYIEVIHDRLIMEIMRGCSRGCRFCQAGYIYRPVRERSVKKLREIAAESIKNTGYQEISLSSLSSGDHSCIAQLVEELKQDFKEKRVVSSLPSLRLDSFNEDFISDEMRRSSLTFAPEAGSQRLRNVINKNITEEDLLRTISTVFSSGYDAVKLYFMLGLPTETMDDVAGIATLVEKCVEKYKELHNNSIRNMKIVVSTSFFVPKPFTPFQWCKQETKEELDVKREYLQGLLKKIRGVEYRWHENKMCYIEAALARGDRRLSEVLYKVWKKGAHFDSWNEHFYYYNWIEAFREANLNVEFYTNRERDIDEVLPWDIVDCGVTKKYLQNEYALSKLEETTKDCRNGCTGCGMNKLMGGKCPCEYKRSIFPSFIIIDR